MPDLGVELHHRWAEWIFIWYPDIDDVCAVLVSGTWWSLERSLQMCQIIATSNWISENVGLAIGVDVCNLLCDTTSSVGGHFGLAVARGKTRDIDNLRLFI
jgi:hypothetical protein